MKTIAERLVEAREKAGFQTTREAAASLGMPYPTYAAHENGTTGFKLDQQIHYARKYKVSLDWLLTGKGRGPSPENNQAWEIYLLISDFAQDDLAYVRQAVDYVIKKTGKAA